MASLIIDEMRKRFGAMETVKGASFEARKGEFVAFAAPQPIEARLLQAAEAGGPVTLGIRPENLRIDPSAPALLAKVEITENLGSSILVHARTSDGAALVLSTADRAATREGSVLPLSFAASPHIFDAEGRRISNG